MWTILITSGPNHLGFGFNRNDRSDCVVQVPESVQLGKHIADSVEVNKINQSTHQIAHLLKPEDLLEYRCGSNIKR